MTLAADIRNHGRDIEVEEAGDAHEVVLLRFCNLQWDFHLKGSVLSGHGGICLYGGYAEADRGRQLEDCDFCL